MVVSPIENQDGIAFVEGEYLPISEAKIPILDWGFLRSDANQDTISVWKGSFFRLEDHLDRFERNVAKLRMICPYNRSQIRSIMRECVRRCGFSDAYIQIIATRGIPPTGVRDPRRCQNRFYAFCLPYVWIATAEQQQNGLKLIVSSIQRIPATSVDPTLKHYHWLDFEMALFEAYEQGGDTVVLVNDNGCVTEGPGFNLFIVSSGAVITPENGVLDGMTRQTLFELCSELKVPYEQKAIPVSQLIEANEVFLSSTAGGLLPVTSVNNQTIGKGVPGPIFQRLRKQYWQNRESGWHGTPVEP